MPAGESTPLRAGGRGQPLRAPRLSPEQGTSRQGDKVILPTGRPIHPFTPSPSQAPTPGRRFRRRRPKLTEEQKRIRKTGGLWFEPDAKDGVEEEKRSRARRTGRTYHPKYVAAARDLCARYLEEVQAGRLLPEAQAPGGKYDLSRQIDLTTEGTEGTEGMRLLDAA